MKLHLPKLLRAAVIAAVCGAGITQAAELTYTTDTDGNRLYDVGEAGTTRPSLNKTKHQGNLTLNNRDTLGIYDNNQFVTTDLGSYIDGTKTGIYTNNLSVSGDITLNDNSKIVLGGQYKITSSKIDEFTGIFANSVAVNDSATLIAGKSDISNLTATGNATVLLHNTGYNNYTGGNTLTDVFGRVGFWDTSKVSEISGTITVKDKAQVVIGVDNGQNPTSKTNHWLNSIGGSITQSSATGTEQSLLQLKGKTHFTGNLNIQQSGGKMEIGLLSGDNTKSLVFLGGSGNNVINQTGDATLKIGKMISAVSGSARARQLTITQSGIGTITLDNGVEFKTANASTASSITQSGGGTVNLTGDFSSAVFNVDLTDGTLVLTSSGTKLRGYTMTLTSGVQLDNNGKLTVGTGAEGTTGVLNVTTGGTLNLMLDGTNAAINVGAASTGTKTVTGWEMAEGSTLGIGLTESGLGKTTISAIAGSDKKKIVVTDALVATVADGSDVNLANFKCEYAIGDINGSDVSQWQIESEGTSLMKDSETGDIVLGTTLIYNPWIEITDGVERDADIKDTYVNETTPENSLLTGLDISGKNVTLSGNNSYSYGTRINGVTVTLGHENALGTLGEGREITTTGKAGLTTADGVTANLPGIIQNSGELTMEGSFKTENTTAYTGEVADLYLNTNFEEGANGFKREGDTYQIVDNGAGASLTVGSGTSVLVGTEEMDLFTDGLAGKVNYDKYYIKTDNHEADAQTINHAAEGKTTAGVDVTVVMTAGQLTANESITVNTTNGKLVITGAETVVSGTVKDTTVQAEGGEIDSIILGNTSVTINGDTTISGTSGMNDYTGGITINGAQVTLKNQTALGKGAIATTGVSRLESVYQTHLYQAIQNTGTLTMSGAYEAINPEKVTLGEAYYTLEWTENSVENGFKREAGGTGYQIVDNGENGKLIVADYTPVVVNDTIYSLNDDGLVYETMPNFGIYYIQAEGEGSEVMSQDIRLVAADVDQDAVKVIMTEETGKLTVTADSPEYPGLSDIVDFTVESTAGTVISQTGAVVKGSLANTTIEAAGGEIQAQITEGSSVKVTEDTTLSGADNTYTGGYRNRWS